MIESLKKYKEELEQELTNILDYWMVYTIDKVNGGFYGKIDNNNNVIATAPKGSVLNSRILWTFSAAYHYTSNPEYLNVADRGYEYIINHFLDKDFGGVYWSVNYEGYPLDTKKQIYAIAFALYGISEYAASNKSQAAKQYALELYKTVEQYSHDTIKKGYIEAFIREWQEIKDLRLSAKDSNEKKSMNTHLHVLEAYANLYRIWPDQELKKNIREIIELFLQHIIDAKTNHLVLFFDDDWQMRSKIISYGHDIEAAWLLMDAAEIIGDEEIISKVKNRSIEIANAAAEGLDKDDGLWYEYEIEQNHLIKEKHWWPQAEAMIGFFNAWQITGEEKYLSYSINNWRFVQNHILNTEKGEWFWGVKEDYSIMPGEDKVGVWKCPYHNARACLELIKRINQTTAYKIPTAPKKISPS